MGSRLLLDNNKTGCNMYVNKLQLDIYKGRDVGDLPKNFAGVA